MVGIGGRSLESVNQKLLERQDVGIDMRVRLETHLFTLLYHCLQRAFRFENGRAVRETRFSAGRPDLLLERFAVFDGFIDQSTNRSGSKSTLVKVEKSALVVNLSTSWSLTPTFRPSTATGRALHGIDQQILQGRDIGLLAAYADFRTAFPLPSVHTDNKT